MCPSGLDRCAASFEEKLRYEILFMHPQPATAPRKAPEIGHGIAADGLSGTIHRFDLDLGEGGQQSFSIERRSVISTIYIENCQD